MLGIPILAGLRPHRNLRHLHPRRPALPVEPGYVGQAIPGIEMKIGDNEEILVSGPHIFRGLLESP